MMADPTNIAIEEFGASGALADGAGGYIEVADSQGNLYRFVFAYDAIDQIIGDLDRINGLVHAERERCGKPTGLKRGRVKEVNAVELRIAPVDALAILNVRYSDKTSHDVPIPLARIPSAIVGLQRARLQLEGLSQTPGH
jgi:hypothetical protein